MNLPANGVRNLFTAIKVWAIIFFATFDITKSLILTGFFVAFEGDEEEGDGCGGDAGYS